jgi:hypothetical protein
MTTASEVAAQTAIGKQNEQLRDILALLKEYTAKLENVDIAQQRDQAYFARIQPAARKLAQFVSQRLNGVDEGALHLELELRLAEYEAALQKASILRTRF